MQFKRTTIVLLVSVTLASSPHSEAWASARDLDSSIETIARFEQLLPEEKSALFARLKDEIAALEVEIADARSNTRKETKGITLAAGVGLAAALVSAGVLAWRMKPLRKGIAATNVDSELLNLVLRYTNLLQNHARLTRIGSITGYTALAGAGVHLTLRTEKIVQLEEQLKKLKESLALVE